jgi:hypothetical protein
VQDKISYAVKVYSWLKVATKMTILDLLLEENLLTIVDTA